MYRTCFATIIIALQFTVAFDESRHSCLAEQSENGESLPGHVRLVLPPVIFATPGIECNVYFDNVVLVLDTDDYAFDVTCHVGLHLQERWAYTPSAEDDGEYPILIEVYDEFNSVVARGQSTVRVAQANPTREPATLLLVGASFTEYSIYPRQILELSRRDGATRIRLIGSRGPKNMPPTDDLRHEGYSGWTAEAFAVLAGPLSRSGYHSRGATGSPFVYESENGSKKLDFDRYCAEFNHGFGPDLISTQVGTNDVFNANDETIEATIDRMFSHYDNLIESMHSVRADSRIGVQMVTPPSTSQDGFRNYRGQGKQSRWQFRRNQHRLMERMVRHFGNRTDEHIYLIPSYLNLDTAHHFPTWSSKRNTRADQTSTRVNNGTHPSEPGYAQISDAVYSWCVCMLASPSN